MLPPSSTYRIQFTPAFGFEAAGELVEYLGRLGVTTLYASPIFQARPGSTHGYDVADPTQINRELGSTVDLERLGNRLREHGIGWLQDFVPNHMVYHTSNRWLMDVFEKGPSSPYFAFFDIVWDHLRLNLWGKLIAPFLGDAYSDVLDRGELRVQYGREGFSVRYHEMVYPLRIESYAIVVGHGLDSLKRQLGEDDEHFIKTLAVVQVCNHLPYDPAAPEQRNAQIRLAKEVLWELYETSTVVREFVESNVALFNRNPGLMDSLLSRQWFRLTYWRVATQEINYQRFFNINDLISLRVEDESVFDGVHELLLRMVELGWINGVRVDHLDGLYDPAGYLRRLRRAAPEPFIVVEKILDPDERLPTEWPVEGTTGYDFLNEANGLFVDSLNEDRFTRVYEEFTGESAKYEETAYEKRRLMIERHLIGDLDNLAHHLKKVSTTMREGIDLTMDGLRKATVELASCFPVYRTYVSADGISEADRSYLQLAHERARARRRDLSRELGFILRVLRLELPTGLGEEDRQLWYSFVLRFQQFTGPLMAKGIEDTAFYVFNRLISLNEVGGDPGRFGVSVDRFHRFNSERLARTPRTLNATATHDTKRGEDARARINVLSEFPEEWRDNINLWREVNRDKKTVVGDLEAPDRNDEYLLYQTLIGVWPFEDQPDLVGRIIGCMIKSAREAKRHTFWLEPNSSYEAALAGFCERILDPVSGEAFLKSFVPFQKRIATCGVLNSLSQLLLKITSPGLPDFYQGTELWDFSLVDPDSRRPVDFTLRRGMLDGVAGLEGRAALWELLASPEDGRLKLFTLCRALRTRVDRRSVFDQGDYVPLRVTGHRSENVVAFSRRDGDKCAVVVVPRLIGRFVASRGLIIGGEVWKDTTIKLPDGAPDRWRCCFTRDEVEGEGEILVSAALSSFPVGFLTSEG